MASADNRIELQCPGCGDTFVLASRDPADLNKFTDFRRWSANLDVWLNLHEAHVEPEESVYPYFEIKKEAE